MLDIKSGNEAIKNLIRSGSPFLVNRMRSEIDVVFKRIKGLPLSEENLQDLFIKCGVYPFGDKDQINLFIQETMNSMVLADAWGYCTFYCPYQDWLIKNVSRTNCVFDFMALEPIYHEEPWTLELAGKKVLIVHPYIDTMKKQEPKLVEIAGGKEQFRDVEFKYVKAVQSMTGNAPHGSFSESYQIMKDEIAATDFDVALLGCGGYGMPLSGYIKSIGKSAVYIGGGLQLVFGIKGQRWDDSGMSKHYNEHWVRPSAEETPNNYKLHENGAYF